MNRKFKARSVVKVRYLECNYIMPKFKRGDKVFPFNPECSWTHAIIEEIRPTLDEDWQYRAVVHYPNGQRMGGIFFESEFVSAQGIKRAIERINEKKV